MNFWSDKDPYADAKRPVKSDPNPDPKLPDREVADPKIIVSDPQDWLEG